MFTRSFIVLASVLAGIACAASFACAQDADSLRVRANASLNSGRYDDARTHFLNLLELDDEEATIGYARTFEAVGEYEAGLEAIDAPGMKSSSTSTLQCARGRLLVALGRYDDAGHAFDESLRADDILWSCAADFADLLDRMGRSRDARRVFGAIFERYEQGEFRTASELTAAGRAAAALEHYRDANSAFRTAHEVDPDDVSALFEWAELFRDKFNDAEARRTYEEALAVNPRHAPSLVGLAHTAGNFAQQEELAQKALSINPNLTDALDLLAGLRILDGMYQDAETLARRALEVNPNSISSLAQLASTYKLRGDSTAYADAENRALEVDPHASDFFLQIADNLTRRYRYPTAARIAERAVEANREDPGAHAELGAALLRLGRQSDARRHVEYAFEADPYNFFAANTLTLLDAHDDFSLLESPHFSLLIHSDERDVLGPLVLDMAERSFDSLRARYPYEPGGRILIEAYNDADDFAVRISGVPHAGLLGVSFGDVVAVNTPHAQSGDAYNWARTLWHEIAHTMAIGVSNHHVPRWLTEGLSVYEEQRGRPEWGREMELAYLSAFENDLLLPLEEIDRGFTRPSYPGQVMLSYYHAGKVIEFIADEFGFDAIIGILETLASGATQEDAIREATGVEASEVDRRFGEAVRQRSRDVAQALGGLPDLPSAESNADAAQAVAPEPLFDHLREGADHLAGEDFGAAESAFEAAIAMYPDYVGQGNAYLGLAGVYRAEDREDDLVDVLRRYLALAEDEIDAALELADVYESRGDADAAAAMLERSLHVAPYDAEVRGRLADLYDETQRYEAAVIHHRAVVALEPSDRAGAYFRLARSMHRNGEVDEARRTVLLSLEVAPDYREAQQLLLEINR